MKCLGCDKHFPRLYYRDILCYDCRQKQLEEGTESEGEDEEEWNWQDVSLRKTV